MLLLLFRVNKTPPFCTTPPIALSCYSDTISVVLQNVVMKMGSDCLSHNVKYYIDESISKNGKCKQVSNNYILNFDFFAILNNFFLFSLPTLNLSLWNPECLLYFTNLLNTSIFLTLTLLSSQSIS